MPATVWSLGSILVDLTVDVPALPERGGDRLATATRTEAGGGFNLVGRRRPPGSAVPVRRAARHRPVRRPGPRRAGRRGRRAAHRRPGRGGDTGFCITLVEPDGERTFVTMPGVEAELDPAELAAVAGPDPATWCRCPATTWPIRQRAGAGRLGRRAARPARCSPWTRVRWCSRSRPTGSPACCAGTGLLTLNQREARLLAGPARVGRGRELLVAVRRGRPSRSTPSSSCARARPGASRPAARSARVDRRPRPRSPPSTRPAPATRTPGCCWPRWPRARPGRGARPGQPRGRDLGHPDRPGHRSDRGRAATRLRPAL